jgi:arylsulfatase A-like enzyme
VGLEEPLAAANLGLDPAHPTLPSLLREQGYRTALIGKWHLGMLPDYGPLRSGYDEFWGNRTGGIDYFTHENAGRGDLWDGDVPIEQAGYYTDLLAERSLAFLDARAREAAPWLLSLHFTAPHWPWEADDAAGRAESARIDAIPGVGGSSNLFHHDGGSMETYAAMVTALDAAIGRVLERLAALGMERDTVVVFTSDNGGERFSDTWPFTGRKTELLEGGIRVPLIVRWPGLAAPGSLSDAPVLSMDFLPTLVGAAGGAPDPDFPSDGIDIRTALSGGALPERTLFWRYKSNDQKAARRGRYKYLALGGNEFLFDIVADPLERGNLKARMPDRFAELRDAFAAWDAGMLSDPAASSYGVSPADTADRYRPGG